MSEIDLPPVCLLVGGRGTRLGPLTEQVPKPLIEVAGRPFIEWPLDQLRDAGFREVVLCVGYRGDAIRDHLGTGKGSGLGLSYSYDTPGLDGTLGAIQRALPQLDDPVPVLYGDTYLAVDFASVVRSHGAASAVMTMTVLENDGSWDSSNARVSGDRVTAYSKSPPPTAARWIDYGFSVFDRAVLENGVGPDLGPLIETLAAEGQVRAWPVTQRFYEIGTPSALRETAEHLSTLGWEARD